MLSYDNVLGTVFRTVEQVWPLVVSRLPWGTDSPSVGSAIKSIEGEAEQIATRNWPGGPASRLQSALTTVTADADWKQQVLSGLSVVELGGVVASVGQFLSPQGPGTCDHCTADRVANVVTSIPYMLVGLHTLRNRKSDSGRFWGASVTVVGCASAIFHATDGKWKSFGRKLDYWTIALSTNALLKAVFPSIPRPVTMAGIAATPFKPFAVSTLNSTAMEVEFLRRAHANPKLQPAQRLHSVCCLLGLACFALEDHHPTTPFIHTLWHGFSTVATATVNALLEDIEREQEMQRLGGGAAGGAGRASSAGRMPASIELDVKQLSLA